VSHWDDGRLLAYADGELDTGATASAEEHLGGCAECSGTLAILEGERRLLSEALLAGDVEPPSARVRQALALERGIHPLAVEGQARSTRRGFRSLGGSRLAQAAVLVLLFAGGASALVLAPPLRSWFGGDSPPDEAAVTTPAAASEAALEVGTQVRPLDGSVEVTLAGLPSGAEIHVSLVAEESALVMAPEGTRFRTGNGRIAADASAGPVRVQLPRGLERGSLSVDGTVYLSMTAGEVRLDAPAFQRTPSELRFRVP